MIDLRQFRQFVTVAETMSFRRAAERLHMAQPPLTVAIKRIEDELGVALFERTNRIVRLTQPGAVLLEEARHALAQAERALLATKRAGKGLVGSVRVTFVPSAIYHFLPRVLRVYRERHPDVALELQEANTAQQILALRSDRADIGIVVPPVPDADDLAIEVVHETRLVAALPEGHALSRRKRLVLTDLADKPWVLFPARQGPGLHSRIVAACGKAGFMPQVAQEALHMETIAGLVAGGLGVALVPASLAASGRRGAVFRDVRGPGTPIVYELAVVSRRNASSPALKAFVDTMRQLRRS